ncbi:hypothetical protein [Heyndrickxia coagulans]|uniref:hypothetical protein n=1 Tax=Heyndrickxia coagulans TaxID=1398 RepID=UPI0018A76B93|nr:hypothetical protein [Heyndrickxia coagulans]MBF8417255.1 hypothetical protein [Heyndrickxia coagulans]
MGNLKIFFKKFVLTKWMYEYLKVIKESNDKSKRLRGKYKFNNRKKDSETLCIILAGYKDFVWKKFFSRIKKYSPKDIDICIVSSGIYSHELDKICEKNGWSYLSVNRNCVTLAQNIAIHLFDRAKMIYKIDEDILITKHFFDTLKKTYNNVSVSGKYEVGFVAPLIPINGYGHVRILEKLGLTKEFEDRFEKVKYISRRDRKIENDPEVAKFFWGKDNIIPSIDKMDEDFSNLPFEYRPCPIRFSIGAILFSRKLWEDMGMFIVNKGNCMGLDEEQLNSYCVINSKAMIIAENTVVGHLSFGNQNQEIKTYFLKNSECF